MKKLLSVVILLALVLTLALPALADQSYNGPIPLYVNVEKVRVYKEQSTDSKTLKKLKGAASVMPELVSDDGAWIGILVEDTKHGGQTIGWVKAECLVDYYPQSLCPHEYGEWTVEREATCTEEGYRYRFCLLCGERLEDSIKKKDHDWTKWNVTKKATCSTKGSRTRTCKNCGKEQTDEFYEDHDFDAWEVTVEPTCTRKGERQHKCKVCGTIKTQELDMLPHDYTYQVTVEATDHSAGVRTKVCQVCGANGGEESFDPEGTIRRGDRGENVAAMQQLLVEQGYLNAGGADGIFGGGTEKALTKYQQDRGLNPDGIGWPQTLVDLEHDYGPWTIVTPMTRTQAGERVRVCRGCGFEQHETIESGTTYVRGDRGESIRALQQIVKVVGYDAGSFDGIYGKKLDAAMAGFAGDNGLVIEEGKVRPADVDALVNAWFAVIPAEEWKGEGGADTPVNLALTVTPNGAPDESGIHSYSWTLTNLGSQQANFTALLLTFGDTPDFRKENLVMAVDGFQLKPSAANDISGTFSADVEWGEGNLNFAALAVSEADGGKWLSNAVSFENAANPAEKTVAPMDSPIDVNNLPDGIYPVGFDRGDVFCGASGTYMNAVRIYTQDWYDIVDVNTLKVGDTVIVEGEAVPVLSLQETEYGILVNDGQDARSFYFRSEDDSNGFAIQGLNDMTTYTEQGLTTLTVDPSATFTDAWDIESEPVTVSCDDIAKAMQDSGNDSFVPYNTTVRVEGGKVVEINRVYMP